MWLLMPQVRFAPALLALCTALLAQPVPNRAPLAPNAFTPLPLTAIQPRGWLLRQLQTQASGLSGHLDEFWKDVGPNSGWLGGTGESWERGPYYMDGLVPLAYLTKDPRLIAKIQPWMNWTLDHQRPDGAIGPPKNTDWWPNMVMLKALTQYQEATGDPRVVPLMSKYFAYHLKNADALPLKEWAKFRWQDEALSIVWLYNRTGEPALLDLARKLHQQGFDWEAYFADFPIKEKVTKAQAHLDTHGVNNGQALKTAALWSLLTGAQSDRDAFTRQLTALFQFHGLPNGIFSADEHLAGLDPNQGTELCTVVETMFSFEVAIRALGNPSLGDRLEKIAFNPLPGTISEDMWSHQYDQQPNQIECSRARRPWSSNGPDSNLFGLEPNFGCCTANFHQGWPKFVENLWMATPSGGLALIAYSPSQVTAPLGGATVKIVEDTGYPFRETVTLTVEPSQPAQFPLELRIPAWAANASVRVDGRAESGVTPGSFHTINRLWKSGDRIEIRFRMTVRASYGFRNALSLERGPLVYSLPIGEDWQKLKDYTHPPLLAADWAIHPTTPWNYALNPDLAGVTVSERPIGDHPFSAASSPVQLTISARRLDQWTAEHNQAGPLPVSPVADTASKQTVILIPYGAARLRITAFPWTR